MFHIGRQSIYLYLHFNNQKFLIDCRQLGHMFVLLSEQHKRLDGHLFSSEGSLDVAGKLKFHDHCLARNHIISNKYYTTSYSIFLFYILYRSRCRHLHPVDLPKMKLSTSTHFRLAGEHDMAMRSAAFLSAIKKGAHFIFQANPGKQKCIHFFDFPSWIAADEIKFHSKSYFSFLDSVYLGIENKKNLKNGK